MAKERGPEPDRAWAAAALARLGRMDVVVAHLDGLPEEVAVSGLTAPYTSFRDHGCHGPLDYRPLEAAIVAHPGRHDAVFARLRPGSSLCAIGEDETVTALDALASPWPVVRCHAVLVLEHASLSGGQRGRFTGELMRLRREDPDVTVRRTAAGVDRRLGDPR
ncbi:hypothetical protein ACF1G0_22930 [Streptomyces sp. NPDC013953]|uniref:hypothetical protein n=1 Tax=Streptomyces sp. NPDC013953 TaxID=3364868 RepID=UPI003702A0E9